MGAALTLSISVISSLLPLIKQGTDAWKAISEARDAIKAAQAANRDLTTDEFLDLMTRCHAAGNELQALAAAAEAELLAKEATKP
jgi:hypothetical protein